jgi:hypothetical protein
VVKCQKVLKSKGKKLLVNSLEGCDEESQVILWGRVTQMCVLETEGVSQGREAFQHKEQ